MKYYTYTNIISKLSVWTRSHRRIVAACGIICVVFAIACFARFAIKTHHAKHRPPRSILTIYWDKGRYTGETVNKIPDGNGCLTKDGSTYTGYWEHGEMKYGTITTAKLTYEGSLRANKFDGYGTAKYKNGRAYWGYWANDYKEGLGLQRDSTGQLEFGYFKEGILQHVETSDFSVGDRVYGIDVSRHQGNISWQDLFLSCNEKGGVNGKMPANPKHMQPVLFAMVKSTQGTNLRDRRYGSNSRNARRCGKMFGAYHFLTMDAPGKKQAQFFIDNTELLKGDFPPLLDLEKNTAKKRTVSDKEFAAIIPIAKEWIAEIKAHYGVNPIIYTNMHVYRTFVATDPELRKYDLWLAAPGRKRPDVARCILWQFSHSGRANGIKENAVDLNLFKGDLKDLEKYIREKGIQR